MRQVLHDVVQIIPSQIANATMTKRLRGLQCLSPKVPPTPARSAAVRLCLVAKFSWLLAVRRLIWLLTLCRVLLTACVVQGSA